jgi:hypothetical protein
MASPAKSRWLAAGVCAAYGLACLAVGISEMSAGEGLVALAGGGLLICAVGSLRFPALFTVVACGIALLVLAHYAPTARGEGASGDVAMVVGALAIIMLPILSVGKAGAGGC